ncbi:MAG: hypothetical protein ABIH29_04100 [Candidatus Micrarchaeota archaeon]
MVKKKNKKTGKKASRRVTKKAAKANASKGLPLSIKKKDLGMLEDDTLKRVKSTLASLDKFLHKWDRTKTHPDEMYNDVRQLQRYRAALGKWYTGAQKARKDKETDSERVSRLREFILICFTYS